MELTWKCAEDECENRWERVLITDQGAVATCKEHVPAEYQADLSPVANVVFDAMMAEEYDSVEATTLGITLALHEASLYMED